MTLPNNVKASYEVVLHDLEAERLQVQEELGKMQARLKELHNSISTLARRINPDALSPSNPLTPSRPSNQKYVNMSVRWAILDLLNDSQAMTTADIAEALLAAGVQTKAANFANNVSAVWSTTMKEQPHVEVTQLPDGKWQLTDSGKRAIEYIRTTGKFRAAMRGGRPYGAKF